MNFTNHGSVFFEFFPLQVSFCKAFYDCHFLVLVFVNLSLFDYVLSCLSLNHSDFFSDHIVICLASQLKVNFFGQIFSEVSLDGY